MCSGKILKETFEDLFDSITKPFTYHRLMGQLIKQRKLSRAMIFNLTVDGYLFGFAAIVTIIGTIGSQIEFVTQTLMFLGFLVFVCFGFVVADHFWK